MVIKCILVQDILHSKEYVYNGSKTLNEYSNYLIKENDITNQILENANENELLIYKRLVTTGYIYNSQIKTLLFKLKEVELICEYDSNNCDCKVISKPIVSKIKIDNFQLNKDLLIELKKRLSEKFDHKKYD